MLFSNSGAMKPQSGFLIKEDVDNRSTWCWTFALQQSVTFYHVRDYFR
jgi:hypothetical protein